MIYPGMKIYRLPDENHPSDEQLTLIDLWGWVGEDYELDWISDLEIGQRVTVGCGLIVERIPNNG